MTRRTKHACSTPGCPNLATRPGRCDECRGPIAKARERRRNRPSADARGYGADWRKIRDRYIARHLTCETEGCTAPSTDVDHLRPRRRGGSDADENLQAMCHAHHARKTVLEDGGFGRPPRTNRTDQPSEASPAERTTGSYAGAMQPETPSFPRLRSLYDAPGTQ